MNKVFKTFLALALVVVMAAPALAEFKFNGYIRNQFYSGEFKSTSNTDGDSQQWVTQRFRAKLTYTLNENVAVVYYGEVDTDWGLNSKGAIGGGGKRGADGVNVETKNVYLDVNFDDTKARLGVQTMKDAFDGIVFFDDMAGISVTQSFGATSLTGVYSKWDEGSKSNWDDEDFYGIVGSHKFNDNLKATAQLYYYDDNDAMNEIFFFGPRIDYTADDLSVTGFAVMQSGELADDTVDTSAYVASVKGSMKIDGGNVNLRFIYGSPNDDDSDDDSWKGDIGSYAFVKENQMIMLIDPYVTDWAKEQYAVADGLKGGYGLAALVASGNHNLSDDMYFKWGAGYYMAADENPDGEMKREGDTIGYEICTRVGKKMFGKVDLSLNAAYADFGDFYDNTVNGTDDPDAIYKAYVMVNVPF
ncbi:MAG: hypothetical protein OET90_01450 [Desulfuromonadales bacterium]|nr:hypothetical protein [Desulfuromonadales bacterium]